MYNLVQRCNNDCSWEHKPNVKLCLNSNEIDTLAKIINIENGNETYKRQQLLLNCWIEFGSFNITV